MSERKKARRLSPFGVELRKIRVERNYTLADLSDGFQKIGAPKSIAYLSAVERGVRPASGDFIDGIAEILSLSPECVKVLVEAAKSGPQNVKVRVSIAENARDIEEFAEFLEGADEDLKKSVQETVRNWVRAQNAKKNNRS